MMRITAAVFSLLVGPVASLLVTFPLRGARGLWLNVEHMMALILLGIGAQAVQFIFWRRNLIQSLILGGCSVLSFVAFACLIREAYPDPGPALRLQDPLLWNILIYGVQIGIALIVGRRVWSPDTESGPQARVEPSGSTVTNTAIWMLLVNIFLGVVFFPPFLEALSTGIDIAQLLPLVNLGLAILFGTNTFQWPWRKRFALRRGLILFAFWIVSVLGMFALEADFSTIMLYIQPILMAIGPLLSWYLVRQAKTQAKAPAAAQRQQAEQNLKLQQTALVEARRQKDKGKQAIAHTSIASLYNTLYEPEQTITACKEALTLWREIGNRPRQAAVLADLGVLHVNGWPTKVAAYFEEALSIAPNENLFMRLWRWLSGWNYRAHEANYLANLGGIYVRLKRPEDARRVLEQALALSRTHDLPNTEALAYHNMAYLVQTEQPEYALTLYDQEVKLWKQSSSMPDGEILSLNSKAIIYTRHLKQPEQALPLLERSLAIIPPQGRYGSYKAFTLLNLGSAYFLMGQTAQALSAFDEALELYTEMNTYSGQVSALAKMSAAHASVQFFSRAISCLEEAIAIMELRDLEVDDEDETIEEHKSRLAKLRMTEQERLSAFSNLT